MAITIMNHKMWKKAIKTTFPSSVVGMYAGYNNTVSLFNKCGVILDIYHLNIWVAKLKLLNGMIFIFYKRNGSKIENPSRLNKLIFFYFVI